MGVCFICNRKLHLGCVRVCSSITPHSMIPYPEKIAELLGDEFVVIITPADHMCNNCSTLLTHMDKLENDLKIVKNEVLSIIHKKYKLLLPHQTVKGVEVRVEATLKQNPHYQVVLKKKLLIIYLDCQWTFKGRRKTRTRSI